MTVPSTISRQDYAGNGVTTIFSVPFRFLENGDIRVIRTVVATGVETVLILNSGGPDGYTLTGAGNPSGGSVTTVTAPTTLQRLSIVRDVEATQLVDYIPNDPFPAETLERALDKLTMLAQQMAGGVGLTRVMRLFEGDTDGAGRYNAGGNRIASLADGTSPTDAATVQQLVSAGAGNFIQAGAGAVVRAMQDKVRERISVKDFGAVGNGVTNDTAAFLAAIAYAQSLSPRGAEILVPRGEYVVTQTLTFTSASLVHGISLVGEGSFCSSINFAGIAAASDGIAFQFGTHFAIRNLNVSNATRHNIVIGSGNTVGGANYCSIFDITNVRSQGAGQNGVLVTNAYLGYLECVWSKNNTGNGFTFSGFHTAIHAKSCEASDNAGIGYSLNGIAYSQFTACGADGNTLQGWAISNHQGVVFSGCGSEANGRDGWFLFSSTVSATGLNAQSDNIRGVEFVGCYGLSNSTVSVGTYATFIGATTADSRAISYSVRGGIGHPGAAGDKAMVLAGASGQITATYDGFDSASFTTADAKSGAVFLRNQGVAGRTCLLQTSGAQSITNATDTTLNWNTTPVSNSLGATVAATTITIPRGVNRVRLSAAVAWDTNSTGARLIQFLKAGSGFVGQGVCNAQANGFSQNSIHSAVVEVAEGDTFSVRVNQSSGGALNITNGPSNGVWFSVEAVN